MALIKCPKCDNSVSNAAEYCPHCNSNIKEILENKKKLIINKLLYILVPIVIILVFLLININNKNNYIEENLNNNNNEYTESVIESDYIIKNANYDTFYKNLYSEEILMNVFGRTDCYHCNRYVPEYNKISNNHKLKVYVFNENEIEGKEYSKIMDLDLIIPARCTSIDSDQKLSDGFGTPLTLFTKSGEVIDCISGYVDADTLNNKIIKIKSNY